MHIADMTMFYAAACGGVRTYLEAKHRRLRLYEDVRHSILTPGARHGEDDGVYQVPALSLPFGKRYRLPVQRGPWRRLLERLQPDLIEAGDPFTTAWAAVDAGRRLDVPVIGFYHAEVPLLAGSRIGGWLGSHMDSYLAHLYSHFDRVLAPSRLIADKLESLGVENVFVQSLGVDLKTFRPERRDASLRQELGLAPDTRLLIFVGRGAREKNLDVLLEAARLLGSTYHLLLVGSGMPRQLPENVTVIERACSPLEVARLMASSDVLLHAGDHEAFGLVVLEAMACGLPVVAARAGALPELVPFHCGRLCRPRDARAMAQTVRELFYGDPRQLGVQARLHVEAHYAWDAVILGLLSHYHAVLGSADLPVAVHG